MSGNLCRASSESSSRRPQTEPEGKEICAGVYINTEGQKFRFLGLGLVAELISTKNMYTSSSIRDHILPKKFKHVLSQLQSRVLGFRVGSLAVGV